MEDSFAAVARRVLAADSDRPLYLRLAHGLERKLVADGPAGLPSARGLAADIGVNRATVNAAYRELSRRGLVTLRPGRRPRRAAEERHGSGPASAPRVVDLARYAPDRELLPHGEVFRWLSLGEGEGEGVAQYGSPWGYEPLRRWLADRLHRHGIAVAPDRILLTSGVQHALDLVLRAVTRPGDAVVVEDPTYPGLPPLLATHDLRPAGVPVGEHGADPDALVAAARAAAARLAIVTPTLHNPTGSVMGEAERRRLTERSRGAELLLVEEYFDPALVIDGPVPPPLRALDPEVVMVGSFSKSLFPGLRVGWLIGPDRLVDDVAALKTATDLSGSPLLEAAAWNLCRRGVFDQQLERLRGAAAERRATVLEALAAAPAGVRWTVPRGGFSLLLSLPAGWSANAAAGRAAQHGIWLLPGPAMSVSGRDDILRLAFAAAGGETLQHGLEKVLGILPPDAAAVPLV